MIPASIWLLEERCEAWSESGQWFDVGAHGYRQAHEATATRDNMVAEHAKRYPSHTACHYEVRVVEYRRVEE